MTLAAGNLNRRITIQRRQTGEDAAGQPLDGWEDVVQVWANVKGQTGLGTIASAQQGVSAPLNAYSFRIRYRPTIDESMRVVYQGTPYDIQQARHDLDRREWTDLVCKVGSPIDG